MTFLIFSLSLKINLQLKEKWSVLYFYMHWLKKNKNILATFFSQSRRILRNSRIPENLELDKQTKEDFIYFIQAMPVPVFLKLEMVGKCSKIKKQRQTCSSNWITVWFFFCFFLLFSLFCLHSHSTRPPAWCSSCCTHSGCRKMFLLGSDRFPGRYRARSSMGSSVQYVLLEVEVGDNTPGIASNLAASTTSSSLPSSQHLRPPPNLK